MTYITLCAGNKAALQERLLQALQEEEQRGNASQQQPDASPDPPATPPSPSQHSDAPVSFYEQPQLDKKYQQQPQTQLDAAQLAASQGSDTESVEGAQYQAASAAAAPSEGLSPATTPVEPAALPSTAPPSEQLTDGSDALSDPAGQDSQPVEAGGHGSSKSGWASLTAERLRTQLRHRGLRTGGLKPALIQRIIDAVGPEVIELTEPMPSPVDYTTVGASDADTGADAAPEASSSDVGDLSSYK